MSANPCRAVLVCLQPGGNELTDWVSPAEVAEVLAAMPRCGVGCRANHMIAWHDGGRWRVQLAAERTGGGTDEN